MLSNYLFSLGVGINIILQMFLLCKQRIKNMNCFMIISFASLILIISSWVVRETYEKYSPNWPYRTGKLVGGTVFASYPENVPGLGWI